MTYENHPVQHNIVLSVCRMLGYDPIDVKEIIFTTAGGLRVLVEAYDRDEDGRLIVDHVRNEVVTNQYQHEVTFDEPAAVT